MAPGDGKHLRREIDPDRGRRAAAQQFLVDKTDPAADVENRGVANAELFDLRNQVALVFRKSTTPIVPTRQAREPGKEPSRFVIPQPATRHSQPPQRQNNHNTPYQKTVRLRQVPSPLEGGGTGRGVDLVKLLGHIS